MYDADHSVRLTIGGWRDASSTALDAEPHARSQTNFHDAGPYGLLAGRNRSDPSVMSCDGQHRNTRVFM
jgi:hypothetical protein